MFELKVRHLCVRQGVSANPILLAIGVAFVKQELVTSEVTRTNEFEGCWKSR